LTATFAVRSYRWLRVRLPQPWSRIVGVLAYSPVLISGRGEARRELSEEPVIERLSTGDEPLERVGAGMSERVIEIPWVMRRLAAEPATGRVLDIGTAFSPMVYKRLLVRQSHAVEAADLAETQIAGLRSHVADVRSLPFPDASFDVAVCLSTLEHIGMDNAQYNIQSGGAGDVQALRELGRVASTVLVTVPGGADEDMGWQRQYSPPTFRRIVEEAGLRVKRIDLFAHDPARGWSPALEDEVERRSYGKGAVAAAASICAELSR
jgi:hypothetical protein